MPTACRSFARCGSTWTALAGLLVLTALLAAPARGADEQAEIRALLANGQPAAALDLADRAIAAQPRGVPVLFLRGVALMDLGRDAEALAHFERMSQAYPELPDPWNNIALLHVRAGRLDQARQALEFALRNDPGHRTARANIGLVHLMLAAQAWEMLAASGPIEPLVARRLEAVRALLADGGR
jgi:tetratricopeptide (TPR) repeat protein